MRDSRLIPGAGINKITGAPGTNQAPQKQSAVHAPRNLIARSDEMPLVGLVGFDWKALPGERFFPKRLFQIY